MEDELPDLLLLHCSYFYPLPWVRELRTNEEEKDPIRQKMKNLEMDF